MYNKSTPMIKQTHKKQATVFSKKQLLLFFLLPILAIAAIGMIQFNLRLVFHSKNKCSEWININTTKKITTLQQIPKKFIEVPSLENDKIVQIFDSSLFTTYIKKEIDMSCTTIEDETAKERCAARRKNMILIQPFIDNSVTNLKYNQITSKVSELINSKDEAREILNGFQGRMSEALSSGNALVKDKKSQIVPSIILHEFGDANCFDRFTNTEYMLEDGTLFARSSLFP